MVKHIFRLSVFMMFLAIGLVFITPVLSVNKLLYPIRIDSLFVRQQENTYDKLVAAGKAEPGKIFLYSPDQLHLAYENLDFVMSDSIHIRGWMVRDSSQQTAPMLLIIPNIDEGSIYYLNALSEFPKRGIHVCVIDMRGQGMSQGNYYDPAVKSISDLKKITAQIKKMTGVSGLALLGSGTGAGIIINAAFENDTIANALVLQNPPLSLSDVYSEQAEHEWGSVINLFRNVLEHEYENGTGIRFDDCIYIDKITEIYIPHMMVVANHFSQDRISETLDMYKASNYFRKRLLIDKGTYMKHPGFDNSKTYYDFISAFVNSSAPRKKLKSRFRKFATN